jgi:preprotein translocase subunit SecE
VARDRQRAKQRKARRGTPNPGPALSQPRRTDVPGELDHASGEVDEFEASLLSGADGVEAQEEPLPAPAAAVDGIAAEHPEELDEEEFDELEDEVDEAASTGRAPAGGVVTAPRGGAIGAPAAGRGPARVLAFLRASWAELQRVQWPDRRQVAQATGVVLGFVIVAGLYLGLADQLAQKIVNAIL